MNKNSKNNKSCDQQNIPFQLAFNSGFEPIFFIIHSFLSTFIIHTAPVLYMNIDQKWNLIVSADWFNSTQILALNKEAFISQLRTKEMIFDQA